MYPDFVFPSRLMKLGKCILLKFLKDIICIPFKWVGYLRHLLGYLYF